MTPVISAPIKGEVIHQARILRSHLREHPERLYVFGDNMERRGMGGQAAEMRGEPNAVGIPTKWSPYVGLSAYFCDADLNHPEVRDAIDGALGTLKSAIRFGRTVVLPKDGIGTGLAQLPIKAPAIYRYITNKLWDLEHGC